jgi:hypothetical protein
MAMSAITGVVLTRKVGARLRDDESHQLLSAAMTQVVVAAIHPARHLGLGLGRSSSRGMLEDPIQSATHAAVETLIERLQDLVETLPAEAVDRLASEQVAAEHGFE